MQKATANLINRIPLNPETAKEREISILWIMAATGENRNTLNFRNHRHTFFEIHLITNGYAAYGFGRKEITVDAGRLLIIPPKQSHRVIRHSDDFLKITIAAEIGSPGLLNTAFTTAGIRTFAIPLSVLDSMDFIADCRKNFGNYADSITESRLKESVYIIADSLGGKERPPSSSYDSRIFRAKKYIEDNPASFFTCEEIAAYCRLSAKQMARLFEKHEGVSLLSYIHEQKISLAQLKLTQTDEPQESIANSLGFSSVHYFNKFFMKHTGITPGEYRRKNRL